MTYQTDCTLPEELLEQIAQQGLGCAAGYHSHSHQHGDAD